MKKMLLFVAALFTAATSFAQGENDYEIEEPTWTKTLNDVVAEASDVNVNAPLVITKQGDVIKAGTFTQAFKFAGKELDPIAKSAYILKYDKNSNEVWANALRGAATVTAITADKAGNVFVAGVFADKVIITSTDGQTAEIYGMEDNFEQVSGFIASFDKNGKLLAHRQFVPEFDPALVETYMYFPDYTEVYFRINNIKVANGKVYITANYTGVNKIDEVVLQGRVLNVFDFMYMDINSAVALQLDKNLTEAKLIADVQTTDAIVNMQMGLHDINLAVDGENVFVAWTGTGNLTMTTEKESKGFSFEYTDDGQEHPFVVANITTGQTKTFHAPIEESYANFFTIADMQVDGGKLYMGGTFIGALPFDNKKTSTGACDAFLTALNTSDLSVVWAQNSGINEGEANKFNEMVIGMDVSEDVASVIVNTIDMGTKEIVVSTLFGYDFEENECVTIPVSFKATAISTGVAGSAINSNIGTESTLRYYADENYIDGLLLNAENFPDANFRAALAEILKISEGDEITDEMIAATTSLDVSRYGKPDNEKIADLAGIEHFTALTSLDCNYNNLTSLDVSKNTALTNLDCGSNQLNSLGVSKNTALYNLDCSDNQLTSLDVSKNTALRELLCAYNQLTSLNVSQNTALKRLYCWSNQLTSLDVSGCTALLRLDCWSNQLTSLDVSGCTALYNLDCSDNQLTSLDVSKNTALTELRCYNNQIKGKEMDALVASLPTVESGQFYVINTQDANEGNVCTKSQVAVAKEKGWTVYAWSGSWQEYEGSEDAEYIVFSDENVKAICVANWDTNGDGELSYDEAAAVTDLGTVFYQKTNIISFDELQYFTGLTEINDYAFYSCSNLKTITFPKTILRIGEAAFFGNGHLQDFELPNGLISIEHAAFGLCRSLMTLYIPKSVTYISSNGMAFRDCTGLETIVVDEDNPVYDSRNNCNAIINRETLTLVNGCKNTIVPDGVVKIGGGAFYGQYSIKELVLPASVKIIGDGAYDGCGFEILEIPNTVEKIDFAAFWNCFYLTTIILPEKTPELGSEICLSKSLNKVISYNKNPLPIKDNVFDIDWYGNMTTATLYVPEGCKEKYKETEGWKRFQNIVEMETSEDGIDPVDEDDNIDYGSDLDENSDLDGNVIGDIFYNISDGNGEYDPGEGCIVITKPTDDGTVNGLEGKDIFGEDVKNNFTGIIFIVPEGRGTIKVEAQTTGNMLLKVKIGSNDPVEMELNGKLKISIPYYVSEESKVYIYAGAANEAKGFGKASSTDAALKIYGIEFLRDDTPTDIDASLNDNGQMTNDSWYTIDGVKLNGEPTKKGIYIQNGRKVVLK